MQRKNRKEGRIVELLVLIILGCGVVILAGLLGRTQRKNRKLQTDNGRLQEECRKLQQMRQFR